MQLPYHLSVGSTTLLQCPKPVLRIELQAACVWRLLHTSEGLEMHGFLVGRPLTDCQHRLKVVLEAVSTVDVDLKVIAGPTESDLQLVQWLRCRAQG